MGSKSIRVGLVGIGNCASSLVQGLTFYRDAKEDEPVPGLMHANLGGYHVGDIEISAAFDVAASKVGRDVAEAIYAAPNNTFRFANAPSTGVVVQRGRTLDGIGRYLREEIEESDVPAADVADVLRQTETDVLVSYLPVGSEVATRWYAEQALAAGCGFVNCIPVFIASDKSWQRKFAERGLPLIGDDIKSQVGATIVHRLLANLFRDRGGAYRQDVPAQLWRQYRLSQYARAGTARIEENIQDPICGQPDGHSARGRRHSCGSE